MTVVALVLGALLVGTAAVAVALVGERRRVEAQLVALARKLDPDAAAPPEGLAGAAAAVEALVDRNAARREEASVARSRMERVLAMIPQGIVLYDAEREVVFENKAATTYLAARHEDALVEEAISALVDDVVLRGVSAPSRTVDLFGPPARALALRAVGLVEGGQGASALVVIDDVTDRRRLEAVRRDFVANISHELKTPVGALGLLAETLLAEDDPDVAQRLAERMVTEAFRVAHTIDDLLELSRIEAGEAPTRERVPLAAVAEEAMSRVRGAASQRGIAIEVAPIAADLAVDGDRRQLVSATYNLLDNAVKYSDEGASVSLGAVRAGPWVELTVQDHGTGIPRRDLERIFERFYRVDRARSRRTGGTGLGLAIVNHVAVNHAGEVAVESSEGEGSTFTLRLPARAG